MTDIKERPILFSAPMVRAILDGRKTVTRRPVKGLSTSFAVTTAADESPLNGVCWKVGGPIIRCPYGKPGDRLYVRETCFINDYREAGVPVDERASCEIHYRADGNPDFEGEEELIRWRPSIHMPRWACRILLEITDVRVERLQDISEEQALEEGVRLYTDHAELGDWYHVDGIKTYSASPRKSFELLWSSINGADSWKANPWVWIVEFKRVTP